jgi:hypothetical protein
MSDDGPDRLTTANGPDLLAALRQRERDLETDAASTRARLEEVREMIALLARSQGPRRGRPPGPRAVFTPRRVTPSNPPLHVEPPDDDELPFQSDAPGA